MSDEKEHILLQEILELLPYAILIVDLNGNITHANELAASLFEYEVSELTHQTVETLVPPETRDKHASMRDEFVRQPYPKAFGVLKLSGWTKSNQRVQIDVSLMPVYGQSGDTSVIALIEKVSASSEIISRLKAMSARLQEKA